ncbi:MAG: hypothetical protein QOH61_60 [Chloroflexota bacterium]|nr:hypothetical protein [Chloroflexota bacterium]
MYSQLAGAYAPARGTVTNRMWWRDMDDRLSWEPGSPLFTPLQPAVARPRLRDRWPLPWWGTILALFAVIVLAASAVDLGYGATQPLAPGHLGRYPLVCAQLFPESDCVAKPKPGELYAFEFSVANTGSLPVYVDRVSFGDGPLVIVDAVQVLSPSIEDGIRDPQPFASFLLPPHAERSIRVVAHTAPCMTVTTDGSFLARTSALVTYRWQTFSHDQDVDIGDILTFPFTNVRCPIPD